MSRAERLAFHPDPGHRAEPGHPFQQVLVALYGRGERLDAEQATDLVQHGGHVHAVRIKMTLVLGGGYPETARALSDRVDYDPVVILAAPMGGPSITPDRVADYGSIGVTISRQRLCNFVSD